MADAFVPPDEPDTMDTAPDGAVRIVAIWLAQLVIAVIELEFMTRAVKVKEKICAPDGKCVHCGAGCISYCPLCAIYICGNHKVIHKSKCAMEGVLPDVLVASDKFDIIGLTSKMRTEALPLDHPCAAPACGTNSEARDQELAIGLLQFVSHVLVAEVPDIVEHDREMQSMPLATAVQSICQSAAGFGAFASVVATDDLRGPRCLASRTPHSCCPVDLARCVAPKVDLSWILLMLSFDHPDRMHIPECSNGDQCFAQTIQTPDRKACGRRLREIGRAHV